MRRATCGWNSYVVLLPGLQRQLHDDLQMVIGDPLTPMLVAGFKPKGFAVTFFRVVGSLNCGAAVDLQKVEATTTTVEDDGTAYYASNYEYENPNPPNLLKVVWPSGAARFVQVTLRVPEETLSGDPTYLRLDLTPQVLAKLLLAAPDSLNCI